MSRGQTAESGFGADCRIAAVGHELPSPHSQCLALKQTSLRFRERRPLRIARPLGQGGQHHSGRLSETHLWHPALTMTEKPNRRNGLLADLLAMKDLPWAAEVEPAADIKRADCQRHKSMLCGLRCRARCVTGSKTVASSRNRSSP